MTKNRQAEKEERIQGENAERWEEILEVIN